MKMKEKIGVKENLLTAEDVKDDITLETVKKQILDGWTNPFTIASNILGNDKWECLPEWDQKIIVARVHKIAVENKELRKKYFS